MPLINKMQPIIDLPVFEWPRPMPATPGATSGWCSSVRKGQRFIYYVNATTFYRYDAFGDSWTQLASVPVTPTTLLDLKISSRDGYRTRLISMPNANTIRVAGILPGSLEGMTVKVHQGLNAVGQERAVLTETFTVFDSGSVTSASSTAIIDSNKNWAINQWRGYQVRLVVGGGSMQIRKVLYNNATTLTLSDPNYVNYDRDGLGGLTTITSVTAGSTTFYQIEASDLVLNQPFTGTAPQPMSMLNFNTHSIFLATATTGAPFQLLYRYDVATDIWYQCVTNNAFGLSAIGTDLSMAATSSFRQPITTHLVTSSTSTQTTLSNSIAFTTNEMSNFVIRLTSGAGEGQERRIVSNTSNVVTVNPPWDITPANSTVIEILPDYDKLWAMGNGQALMMQYSMRDNIWSNNTIFETGIARSGSVTLNGEPNLSFAISTATRSGNVATITTVANHPFRVGDVITSAGASQAQYNGVFTITGVTSTFVFTYTMASDPGASGTYTAQSTTTITDNAKNWAVNSLVGKSVMVMSAATTAQQTNQIRRIASNTANTITIAGTAITAATNGTSKYAIIENNCFGAVESGTATATGSTTLLTDTTKSWAIGQWAGLRVRFTSGPLIGQESVITSNTATSLTLTSGLSASTDTSTGYSILPIQARGVGMTLRYIHGLQLPTDKYRGRYIYSFRGGATTQVDRYNIGLDSWERLTGIPWAVDVFTTGTSYAYDDADTFYIFNAPTHRIFQYNLYNNRITLVGIAPYTAGTATIGNRMEILTTDDDISYLYVNRNSSVDIFRTVLYLPKTYTS